MAGDESGGLILGISIGVVIGVGLAIFTLYCLRYRKKHAHIEDSSSRRASAIPIRSRGIDTCTVFSDSTTGADSPRQFEKNVDAMSSWFDGFRKSNAVSKSGIPEYTYRDIQKGTQNFTTLIGQGAFGPVYKAQMLTGEVVAVKVLATDSKQGEREFETEVKLLGRLHHRNLLNLVGYCIEKGKNMLIYVYMSNGNLASHLYNEKIKPLSWDRRIHIALDVARGLEYLHDGAVPPVIHRDIKCTNILLDQSMKARVADFGLSREERVDGHASNLRGTFGYLDPEYISSRTFTKKSDVYSYGVLLFELIAARNPHQGLMEYVELAAMNTDGGSGWEEIVDSRLNGEFDVVELNEVATLAYKCIKRAPKKRPSMRDIVQVLSRVLKSRHGRKPFGSSLTATPEEVAIDIDSSEARTPVSEHRRQDSADSIDTL
ncbi:calcium/calmodulin-regulated receptor-like kinase 1 [Silene latifolia]|uniref:calcium/calmodulin-regulated receptor-like kinase 1 n=1 Tax=Silene latifolia TaxID=37657 RepID=UPI003D778FCD